MSTPGRPKSEYRSAKHGGCLTSAERVQLRRTKGWRMPADTVKVDRSTRWGNPFCASDGRSGSAHVRLARGLPWHPPHPWSAADTVTMYEAWMTGACVCDPATGDPLPQVVVDALPPRPDARLLKDRHLACWCRPGAACHADVLLRLAASAAASGEG